jgi:hypothetical protein
MANPAAFGALPPPAGSEWEKIRGMQSLVPIGPTRARAARATQEANERFILAVSDAAVPSTADSYLYKPMSLAGRSPLPRLVRVYLYGLTTHLSERQEGAFRIQVTLPNTDRRSRGHFDWSDGAFVVLAGYSLSLDVFALWDAGIYDTSGGIAFSRGCQVLDSTLYKAMTQGIAEQPRYMRTERVTETIVAATPPHLAQALQRRWARTVDRLTGVMP